MDLEIYVEGEGDAYKEKASQIMPFKQLAVFCRGMPPLILREVEHCAKSTIHHAQFRLSFGKRGGPKVERLDRLDDYPQPPTPNPLLDLVQRFHDILLEYDEHGIATGYLKSLNEARQILGLPVLVDKEVQDD